MIARELHMSRPDQDATVEATPPPPEPEPASKGGKSNAMAARLAAFQQPASDGGGPKPFTGGAAAPRAQTLPAKCGLAAKFESQAAVGAESTTLDGAASRARSFGSGGGGIAARAAGLQFNPAMLSPGGAPKPRLLEVSGVGITGQPSWAPFKCELTRDALCLYTAVGRPELVGSIPFADYEASRLPSNPDVAGCVLLQPASAGPLSRHGKAWVRVPSAFDPSTAVRAKEMDAWKAAIDAARAAMHAAAEEATHALLKASVGESTYQQAVEESRRARDSARALSGRLSGGAQDDAEDDGGLADLNRTLSLTLTQVMASLMTSLMASDGL
ncbi:hypothetical protein Ctob_015152 [Chrysochromulina tobinii]|uniref:PH domain-containing protein n=1 Tax=Chrysochromulina tobinii TaxID=1460289 RepID=A0A0M0K9A8_9EUKA|nr:hypothetical protein Ctob_015152 [Chrysochromulina tobinii]|eukprot:KOO34958.1 hypothetical protein Ctob_015152 [Chrysochromulina sp. CCMP291]